MIRAMELTGQRRRRGLWFRAAVHLRFVGALTIATADRGCVEDQLRLSGFGVLVLEGLWLGFSRDKFSVGTNTSRIGIDLAHRLRSFYLRLAAVWAIPSRPPDLRYAGRILRSACSVSAGVLRRRPAHTKTSCVGFREALGARSVLQRNRTGTRLGHEEKQLG